MMFQGTYTTEFYRALHRTIHREFRARRSLDTLRQAMSHPRTLGWTTLKQGADIALRLATRAADRRLLDRLAAVPHRPTGPLTPELTPEAAGRPTVQSD